MNSLDIKFSDDPRFQHLPDTLRALTYVFTHHIGSWLQMYSNLNFMISGFGDLTAGAFFNHLMKSNSTTSEISREFLNIISNTFAEAIKRTPTLKKYIETDEDSVMIMWNFCHFFFVPVRLNDDTIPTNIKIDSLRRWLTTVFILPFNIEYCSKYSGLIKRYNIIHEGIDRFTTDKIKTFENDIAPEWINKVINEYYTTNHFTQEFIRTMMYIVILSSIDILKKYNPFIKEACSINPEYDGRWIPAFGDEMFNSQLKKINELTPLVKLKDS